ncbi:hypothetical protein [Sphingopyxis sp.]|jgi:hypothetical protein|uniref:hypothetical protein n=1 Tax=Sphingopyxis sp. TaxID=1908224 RepID=UPI003F71ABE3
MSLLLTLMMQAAPDLSWADQQAVQNMDAAKLAWELCITDSVIELAPKQAPAEDIADAALADCYVQQQALVATGVELMASGGMSKVEAKRRMNTTEPRLVELRRKQAIAQVLRARP